jgi:thioredoxin 1
MLKEKHLFLFSFLVIISFIGCSKSESTQNDATPVNPLTEAAKSHTGKPLVTFIELGSVNCIPCNMMIPVMKKAEETYGSQVKVLFHDVWTTAGRPHGEKYNIRAIPTQIYLDVNGNEYKRHVGYAPFEDVKEILAMKGVK